MKRATWILTALALVSFGVEKTMADSLTPRSQAYISGTGIPYYDQEQSGDSVYLLLC